MSREAGRRTGSVELFCARKAIRAPGDEAGAMQHTNTSRLSGKIRTHLAKFKCQRLKMSADEPEWIKSMNQRLSLMMTERGVNHGLNFKPRLDDVIVVTWPKCGTTWLQQVLHQLRSGGDMSFDEISEVIPYIEHAYDVEIDLDAEQAYQPRCYKSHKWYQDCPKGAKYIAICREPCATFYSFFDFYNGWFFDHGTVSLHQFIEDYLVEYLGVPKSKKQLASYFVHFLSWWERRNDPNVLFLFFEDMKDDLESAVRMVADFVGIHDEERIKKAVEMSSFEFMKENESKFSEARFPRYRNGVCGLPSDIVYSKVVTGSATKGREMMDEKTKELIQAKWLEVVGKHTGFKDYDELRRAFKMKR